MSVTTKELAKAPAVTDYRVTVRHTPFRTKSRVVEARCPVTAWRIFLNFLHEEHGRLTAAQRKSVGRQQSEWLAERDTRPDELPPHVEVLSEEDHQHRLAQARANEDEARKAAERHQQNIQALAEGHLSQSIQVGQLIAQLPQALAQAVQAALKESGHKKGAG